MGRRHRERHEPLSDDTGVGGHRHARLQQIIQEELAALLRDEVTHPDLATARFVSVMLSVDYRTVRIGFLPGEGIAPEVAQRALERTSPFLRLRLGEAIDAKRVPALSFAYDRDAAAALRAEALLEEGDEGDDPCTR